MRILFRSLILIGAVVLLGSYHVSQNQSLAMSKIRNQENIVEISGRISVKGNEPFTYLCITTSDNREFKISGPMEPDLRQGYQNQIVRIRGIIESEAKGPGFPAIVLVEEFVEE